MMVMVMMMMMMMVIMMLKNIDGRGGGVSGGSGSGGGGVGRVGGDDIFNTANWLFASKYETNKHSDPHSSVQRYDESTLIAKLTEKYLKLKHVSEHQKRNTYYKSVCISNPNFCRRRANVLQP